MFGFPRNDSGLFFYMARPNFVPKDARFSTKAVYAHNSKSSVTQIDFNSLRLKENECNQESSIGLFRLLQAHLLSQMLREKILCLG